MFFQWVKVMGEAPSLKNRQFEAVNSSPNNHAFVELCNCTVNVI